MSPSQLDSRGELQVDPALDYYATHTGQIEIVRQDRTLEQIVFPIPEMWVLDGRDAAARVLDG